MFKFAKPKNRRDKNKTATLPALQMMKLSQPGERTEEATQETNMTGIPHATKSHFETMSGFSFDDVRVHYNSEKPAQLQALAYTQGSQVYIAPSQESHLEHELEHVVQQKAGKVQPTKFAGGYQINDDARLEYEAENQIMQFSKMGDGCSPVVQLDSYKRECMAILEKKYKAFKNFLPSNKQRELMKVHPELLGVLKSSTFFRVGNKRENRIGFEKAYYLNLYKALSKEENFIKPSNWLVGGHKQEQAVTDYFQDKSNREAIKINVQSLRQLLSYEGLDSAARGSILETLGIVDYYIKDDRTWAGIYFTGNREDAEGYDRPDRTLYSFSYDKDPVTTVSREGDIEESDSANYKLSLPSAKDGRTYWFDPMPIEEELRETVTAVGEKPPAYVRHIGEHIGLDMPEGGSFVDALAKFGFIYSNADYSDMAMPAASYIEAK